MQKTYRAMLITSPGHLELVERPVPVIGPDDVLVAVEVCGMCGADLNDVARVDPTGHQPRGHPWIGASIDRPKISGLPVDWEEIGI
jgi:alcohol dehydrogenase